MSKEFNARQRADRSGQGSRNWGGGSKRSSGNDRGAKSSRNYFDRPRSDAGDREYRSGSSSRSNRPYGFKRGNKDFEGGRKYGDGRRSGYGKNNRRDERGGNDERDFKSRGYRKDGQNRRRDDDQRNWGEKKRNWGDPKRDYNRDSRSGKKAYDRPSRSFGDREKNYRDKYRDENDNRGNRSGGLRNDERNKYQDREYRQRYYRSDEERQPRYERDSDPQRRTGSGRKWGDNDRGRGERNWKRPPRKLARDDRKLNPGLEKPADEPEPLTDFDERDIPFSVRVEVRGLPRDIANQIEGHFAAIGKLLEDDPSLALKHANAARRIASRLPVVREIAAEVAYQTGAYEAALSDYRAVLRMTGNKNYLPVIADCERAVGKPEAALRTLREIELEELTVDQATEAVLVEAGARADMGNQEEALRILKNAIATHQGGSEQRARLRYAYADFLERQGRTKQALEWFQSAAKYDEEEMLDIPERIAKLEGRTIEEPAPEEFEVLDVAEEVDEDLTDQAEFDEDDSESDRSHAESSKAESGQGDAVSEPGDTEPSKDETEPGHDETEANAQESEADKSVGEPDRGGSGSGEGEAEIADTETQAETVIESKENADNDKAD